MKTFTCLLFCALFLCATLQSAHNVLINGQENATVDYHDNFTLTFDFESPGAEATFEVWFDYNGNLELDENDVAMWPVIAPEIFRDGSPNDDTEPFDSQFEETNDEVPCIETAFILKITDGGVSDIATMTMIPPDEVFIISGEVTLPGGDPAEKILVMAMPMEFGGDLSAAYAQAVRDDPTFYLAFTDAAGEFEISVPNEPGLTYMCGVFGGELGNLYPPSMDFQNYPFLIMDIQGDTYAGSVELQEPDLTLSGTVIDENDDPVPDAIFLLQTDRGFMPKPVQADATGQYSVDVFAGEMYIEFYQPSVEDYMVPDEVEIEIDGDTEHDLLLFSTISEITGDIYLDDVVQYLPFINLRAETNIGEGYYYREAYQNQDGSYAIPVFDTDYEIFYSVMVDEDGIPQEYSLVSENHVQTSSIGEVDFYFATIDELGVTIIPADLAINIPLNTDIVLEFNDPIAMDEDEDEYALDALIFPPPENIDEVDWEASNNNQTFTLSAELIADMNYQVAVITAEAESGSRLFNPVLSIFSTGQEINDETTEGSIIYHQIDINDFNIGSENSFVFLINGEWEGTEFTEDIIEYICRVAPIDPENPGDYILDNCPLGDYYIGAMVNGMYEGEEMEMFGFYMNGEPEPQTVTIVDGSYLTDLDIHVQPGGGGDDLEVVHTHPSHMSINISTTDQWYIDFNYSLNTDYGVAQMLMPRIDIPSGNFWYENEFTTFVFDQELDEDMTYMWYILDAEGVNGEDFDDGPGIENGRLNVFSTGDMVSGASISGESALPTGANREMVMYFLTYDNLGGFDNAYEQLMGAAQYIAASDFNYSITYLNPADYYVYAMTDIMDDIYGGCYDPDMDGNPDPVTIEDTNHQVTGINILMGLYIGISGQNSIMKNQEIYLYNSPNPFNPSTVIYYNLPDGINEAQLEIFNIRGRKINGIELSTDANSVEWNGKNESGQNASSGIYLYRIVNNKKVIITNKMLLLK